MSESTNNNNTESNNTSKLLRHWPSVFLGVSVIVIFALILFTKQVRSTEYVIVTQFGKIKTIYGYEEKVVNGVVTNISKDDGGLKLRWPQPIQVIYPFDKRIRPFIGKEGRLEETLTKDEKNIIIAVSMNYKIVNPKQFYTAYKTIIKGEKAINSRLRSVRGEVINQYNFSDLININPSKMKTFEVCDKIQNSMNNYFKDYGIQISAVGLSSVNIPEGTTKDVFARMKADRKRVAAESINRGKNEAQRIKDDAYSNKQIMLAKAKSAAETIRAQGDAEAAQYYKIFNKEPKLAAFLRKLEAMRSVTGSKTTLILDTDTAPFDILKYSSIKDTKKTDNK